MITTASVRTFIDESIPLIPIDHCGTVRRQLTETLGPLMIMQKILAFDGPLKQLPRSDVRDRSDLLRLSILAGTGRRSSGTRRTQPEREVRDRGRTVMAPTRHC